MPKFLEDKLKKQYGADSDIPYKVMNKIGVMKGNKETAKGRAMEEKHMSDTRRKRKGQPDSEGYSYNFRNRHGLAKAGKVAK